MPERLSERTSFGEFNTTHWQEALRVAAENLSIRQWVVRRQLLADG